MPGGDRTGPLGMGPMTGRGAGYCAGYGVPGFANFVPGRRFFAWGRGGGRGWRNWFYATGLTRWQRAAFGWPVWGYPYAYPGSYAGFYNPTIPYYTPTAPTVTKQQEIDSLKDQAEYLEDMLNNIRTRLKELETDTVK